MVKLFLVLALAGASAVASYGLGMLAAHASNREVMRECASRYQWVTDGDVCRWYGARSYRFGTCAPSMKLASAYASEMVLRCVHGQ